MSVCPLLPTQLTYVKSVPTTPYRFNKNALITVSVKHAYFPVCALRFFSESTGVKTPKFTPKLASKQVYKAYYTPLRVCLCA